MPYRLVIISPCRDEAQFLAVTLNSMVNQTRPPHRWLIVDDGSTDATPEIVSRFAAAYPWIELLRRERPGTRQLGPGVVSAFNAGLAHLGDDPYDIIAKFDCDLEFEPDCVAAILAHFEDPQVGMAGGATYLKLGNKLILESPVSYHVPGQAKFYRRACFEAIGGLQPIYGWDIIDETDARRRGWRTIGDHSIPIIHHRLQGSSFGIIQGRLIWGRGAYAIGSHPLFALARGLYRMCEHPWGIGGAAFLWGFLAGYFQPEINRITDTELIRYLRKEQLHRLFNGNRLPPPGF